MPADFKQLINGVPWDFSVVELTISTPSPQVISRISNINYTEGLTPGELRGTSPKLLGMSTGVYSGSGSLSIYREEFNTMLGHLKLCAIPRLNAGWMQKIFSFKIMYGDRDRPPAIDDIRGCRFTNRASNNSQGGDPLMVDLDFIFIDMLTNGQKAVTDRNGQ